MEAPVSRLPFWLHELIAEAKRRARQRRLLVVLLLVVVAGVTAAVVLRPSGGGSRSGLSGRAGYARSTSSHFVHFGAFVLTVPKSFRQYEVGTERNLDAFWVARHPRAVSTGLRLPANAVYLWVQTHSATPSMAQRLPLDLHKLHRSPVRKWGAMWTGAVYGGDDGYLVMVFEGNKASAADRAAIERALRSIRRAS